MFDNENFVFFEWYFLSAIGDVAHTVAALHLRRYREI
jgi:hypothetical protein